MPEEMKKGVADPVPPEQKDSNDHRSDTIIQYIEAYNATAEWIRFADAKAGVTLTVGGAMAGLLIPTIHGALSGEKLESDHWIPFWQPTVITLFCIYMLFMVLSGIAAFLCINPLRKKGVHPSLSHCDHFHPAAISARYRDDEIKRFLDDCDQLTSQALLHQVQAALLLDAHISTAKYNKVKVSLKLFAANVFFGFAYFLTLQL